MNTASNSFVERRVVNGRNAMAKHPWIFIIMTVQCIHDICEHIHRYRQYTRFTQCKIYIYIYIYIYILYIIYVTRKAKTRLMVQIIISRKVQKKQLFNRARERAIFTSPWSWNIHLSCCQVLAADRASLSRYKSIFWASSILLRSPDISNTEIFVTSLSWHQRYYSNH